jgi:hypothetical protein
MQELYRVLKPGGWPFYKSSFPVMILTTIRDHTYKIFGQYDHVRIYGRDYFDKLGA